MKKNKEEYQKGDELTDGTIIVDIVGATTEIIVVKVGSTRMAWELSDNYENPDLTEILRLRRICTYQIGACAMSKTAKKRMVDNLAHALYNSLRNPKDTNNLLRFRKFKVEIFESLSVYLRIIALCACIVSGGVFAILSFLIVGAEHEAFGPLMAGILGVIISFLFSIDRIIASNQSSLLRQGVDTTIRMLYGCLCGLAAFILFKAEAIGGMFTNEEYGAIAFTLIAGFSERLIPAFMENFQGAELYSEETI